MADEAFHERIEEAQQLARTFAAHDPKPWPVEIKALDLQAHVGIIAQAILEKRGFKGKGEARDALAEELATAFFILLDIADECGANFAEDFTALLEKIKQQLTA